MRWFGRAIRGVLGGVGFSLAAAAAVGSLEAGEVRMGGTEQCTLRYTGAVEKGDKQQLADVLGGLGRAPGEHVILCLDSPGGSYTEAIEIIDLLLASKYNVGTLIERGASCYSACGLIFLAGHHGDGKNLPNRRLHAAALLGFHGPYIKPGRAEYDPKMVPAAYRAAVRSLSKLIGLGRDELFPESLLSVGLDKGPEEFLMIDTIGKVGRWKIGLIGLQKPKPLNRRMLFQACANSMGWPGGITLKNTTPATAIAFQNRRYRAVHEGFGDESAWTCVADAYDAGGGEFFLDVHWVSDANDPEVADKGALEAAVQRAKGSPIVPGTPWWYVLDGGVKLSETAAK